MDFEGISWDWLGQFRLGQVRLGQVRLCLVGKMPPRRSKLRQGGNTEMDFEGISWDRLGQFRLGQVKLGQVRLRQVTLGYVRLRQVTLGQVRLGQVRLCQVRLGLVGKMPPRRSKLRYVGNTEMDFEDIMWEILYWFHMARSRVIQHVAVSTTVHVLVKLDAGNLLTYQGNITSYQ